MSDELRTFLTDLAIGTGVGLAVGALVACASVPFLKWLHDRSQERKGVGGGRAEADDASATPTRPAPSPDVDFASSVERLIELHRP